MATNDDMIFTGLVDPDGTEVWIELTRQEKSEKSPSVYTPPGKIEQHTNGRLSYEIPAASLVKDAFVDVWNDVENTHYRIGVPTYIGHSYDQGHGSACRAGTNTYTTNASLRVTWRIGLTPGDDTCS